MKNSRKLQDLKSVRRRLWDYASGGFTLLELLVALSIFAVVATMAYGGLRSVLDTRERSERQALQLAELQIALTTMERDIEQIIDRPIRDSVDSKQPALRAVEEGEPLLEFTRTGWRNPTGHARSNLQRVAYRVKDGRLLRSNWAVLDQAQTSVPQDSVLLEGIKGAEIRFFDKEFAAQNHWPPIDRSGNEVKELPKAIELSLDMQGWGRITRLYRVVEGAQPSPS